jgi:hypothetical protein
MATPMVTNWKKIDASKSEGMDATLYMQLKACYKQVWQCLASKIGHFCREFVAVRWL